MAQRPAGGGRAAAHFLHGQDGRCADHAEKPCASLKGASAWWCSFLTGLSKTVEALDVLSECAELALELEGTLERLITSCKKIGLDDFATCRAVCRELSRRWEQGRLQGPPGLASLSEDGESDSWGRCTAPDAFLDEETLDDLSTCLAAAQPLRQSAPVSPANTGHGRVRFSRGTAPSLHIPSSDSVGGPAMVGSYSMFGQDVASPLRKSRRASVLAMVQMARNDEVRKVFSKRASAHILALPEHDEHEEHSECDDLLDMRAFPSSPSGQPVAKSSTVIVSKMAYFQESMRKKLTMPQLDLHPLHEALVLQQGEDLDTLEKALDGMRPALFQTPLGTPAGLPWPLLYAITPLTSASVVSSLLMHRADVQRKWTGAGDWKFIREGMTPLEAVRVQRGKDPKDELGLAAIELLLEAEADRLRKASAEMPKALFASPPRLSRASRAQSWSPQKFHQEELRKGTRRADSEAKICQQAAISSPVSSMRKPVSRHGTIDCGDDPSRVKTVGSCFICRHVQGDPKESYTMDVALGAGTFGSVRKAVHKQTGQIHAIKTCPKSLIPSDELWAEIVIMRQLDHPHVMRLYCTFEDDQNIYIASEMCDGGQLFDAIIQAGTFSEAVAARLFHQMLSAVSYIHFKHICHRDLKPENFLLSRKGQIMDAKVKLIDFGTAKRFDLSEMTTKVCTLHYVAPEVLKRSMAAYTEKVDMWSLGVVAYVMLSGAPPFNDDDDYELMKLIKKGKWSFKPQKIWANVSDEAKDMISRMLKVKVTERWSATEALRHDWVQTSSRSAQAFVFDETTLTQMRTFVAHNKLKKVALQIIARQVPDDAIEQLRDLFLRVDVDHSGTLTVEEMDAALEKLQASESARAEMRRLMSEIEMGQRDEVNYTEFIAATISRQTYLREEVCRAAFHIFDTDGDGFISKGDLTKLLNTLEEDTGITGIDVDEVNQIMMEVDTNGDGKMSFVEFMGLMADGVKSPTNGGA